MGNHPKEVSPVISHVIGHLDDKRIFEFLKNEHNNEFSQFLPAQQRFLKIYFASQWLCKLDDAKLMALFDRFPIESKTLIPACLQKMDADRLYKILTSKNAKTFSEHQAVHSACLAPSFANKYIWNFDNQTVMQWLKVMPEVSKQKHLHARMLYLENNEYIAKSIQNISDDALMKALDHVKKLAPDLAARYKHINLLEHPLVQDRFLDTKGKLIPQFIQKASDGLFAQSIYQRPELWQHTEVEARILLLFSKLPELKIADADKNKIYTMAQALGTVKELDPDSMALLKMADIDIFSMAGSLKTDAQWDLIKQTLVAYKEGISGLYALSPEARETLLQDPLVQGLGDFAYIAAHSASAGDMQKAQEINKQFKQTCQFLKGVGTELASQPAKIAIGAAVGAAVGTALCYVGQATEELHPACRLVTSLGLLLLAAQGTKETLKADLKQLKAAYQANEPYELGQLSTRTAIDSAFAARGLQGLNNVLKSFNNTKVSLATLKNIKAVIKNEPGKD